MRKVFCGRGVATKTKGYPAVQVSHLAVTLGLIAGRISVRFYFSPKATPKKSLGGKYMSISKKFYNSFTELKSVKSLAMIAMLLALRIILGFIGNSTLPFFGNNVKLSGAFLPIAITGSMFGPVPAMIVGMLGDVLSFIMNPTGGAYFPGFTINGILTGLIYGLFLYKNEVTVPKVVIAWVINCIAVEIFLIAYWLFFLYGTSSGKSYFIYLSARLISQAVKCIPEILLILACGKIMSRVKLPQKAN